MSLLDYIKTLATALARQRPLAGHGIALEVTPDGTRIHARQAAPGSSQATGTGLVMVKITGGSGTAHTCDLYANGPDAAATATAVALTTPNVATGEALPLDTWLWATSIGGTYHALGAVWL